MSVLDHPLKWQGVTGGVDSIWLTTGSARDPGPDRLVIFDGDDTLWMTEHLYDEARRRAALVVRDLGLDASEWETLQRRIDVDNVSRFGLSAERFPTSNVEALVEVARLSAADLRPKQVEAVRKAALSVFEDRAPLVEDAPSVLKRLRSTCSLILLTQGDPRVQLKRIDESGLAPLLDHAVVVAGKSPDVVADVVRRLNASPSESWMVGNSLPSDINPATAAGLRAIWIDAHVWEHERRESLTIDGHVVVAKSLADVPRIVLGR